MRLVLNFLKLTKIHEFYLSFFIYHLSYRVTKNNESKRILRGYLRLKDIFGAAVNGDDDFFDGWELF